MSTMQTLAHDRRSYEEHFPPRARYDPPEDLTYDQLAQFIFLRMKGLSHLEAIEEVIG
jgi:hypothetical protein